MKIDKSTKLEKFEDLNMHAEMQARLMESLKAIEKGEVVTLDEFRQMNEKWLKERGLK